VGDARIGTTSLTPAKVLVLAIDAASPTLLEQWAADGTLPNLRAVMARGLVGTTRNVDGFCVGSTWPSWYTGMTPARHGLHYLVQLRPGTYQLYRPADDGLVKQDAFWSHFSRARRRVAVLDVPVSAIDRSLNGIQTVEWGGHDAIFGTQSHPRDLAGRIVSRFGAHPLAIPCDEIGRTTEHYTDFVARLVAGVRLKTAWTLDLLDRGDWDFFIQVFTEAHCAGHQCWHLHDPAHPAHDPLVAAQTGDPLRVVYQAIDEGIGRLLDRAGDARVLVLSLHGMSHAFGAQFLLRDLLITLGVTQPLPPRPKATGVASLVSHTSDGLRAVWRQVPRSVRDRIAPIRTRVRQRFAAPAPLHLGVDARQSRCFPHTNGLAVGGIRLNLAGREPYGIVDQGAVAERLEDQLIQDLLDVVEERSRRPLVRRVLKTREHYSGEHLNVLPDLLVEWDDATPIGSASIGGAGATVRAVSPKIGCVTGTNDYGRTGEHRPDGFFVATGPKTRSGRLPRAVSILDFAPTFARLLDVTLPESDGTAIPELVDA
jgi:predicted AlkP superfamily phosphohydrolase/phosphomutase